jgi:hypothetical protein
MDAHQSGTASPSLYGVGARVGPDKIKYHKCVDAWNHLPKDKGDVRMPRLGISIDARTVISNSYFLYRCHHYVTHPLCDTEYLQSHDPIGT